MGLVNGNVGFTIFLVRRLKQQIILLNFLLNRWLTKAYTIGLIAELNRINVLVNAIGREVRTTEKSDRIKLEASVSQQTANTTLTIKTIKVTRFLIFMTPCKREKLSELSLSRNHLIKVICKT